jgi:hypothetical protein
LDSLAASTFTPEYIPADGAIKTIPRETAATRVGALETERKNWEKRWKDIRDFQLPYLGEFGDTADVTDRGRRRDGKMIDSIAWMSDIAFGAGVMSGLTPPSRQWFKMGFSRAEAEEDIEAMQILDQRQKIVEHYLHKSNFYNCIHNCYMELPFGQAPLGVFPSMETGIRFQNYTIGTYYIGTGPGGRVNTFCRKFTMTPVQIMEQFGDKNLPDKVKDALKSGGKYTRQMKIIWLVMPNDGRIPGMPGNKNMPYTSLYWMEGERDYLYSGGFEEFPVPVARYQVTGQNAYGFGPGWYAEGHSKALQVYRKDFLQAVEIMVKPPMVGPPEVHRINLIPGGYTKESINGQNQIRPLFTAPTNPQWLAQEIQNTEDAIKRIYSADLFLMLSSSVDEPQKTAREVMALQQEKLQQLGPVVERLQDEFLSPLIERTYNILERMGAFDPIPDEVAERLQNEEIKIEYVSPLAQAQKMSGLVNIEQAIAFTGQMAQVWPDVIKKVDPIGTVSEYFELLGAPGKMQRSTEEVQAMMEEEQRIQAQQEQLAQAQAMAQTVAPAAQAAKNLTDAANDGNPALQTLMGINSPGLSSV